MKFALTLALALLATPTRAEIMPQPGPGDPHIQSVAWDPQQVVGLRVGAGYAVTVVFAPDERIETVTLGDSAGWQVTADHAADRLVVKSIGRPPPTNLTVLSEARVYNFTLYALKIDKLDLPPAATASQAGFFVNLNAIGKAQLSISYGPTE